MPPSWCWATIGDTGEYINGFAFKPQHRSNEGLPIIRIQNLTDESKPLNYTTLQVPDEYKISNGEMLVSWSATLDVFVWRRGPALVNQHIFRVVPEEKLIDQRLLFFWLKRAIQELLDTEHLHGSTMKHINRGPFMAHKIPLPPRAEQVRIADKLEELISDLDAGVAEQKAAQRKLVQYRQSLLKAAVGGALTAEWRAERAKRGKATETGAQLLDRILTERRKRWEAKQLAKFKEQGKPAPKGWQDKYPEPAQPDTTDLPALPEGWVWARVGQTGEVQLGRQRAPQFHTGSNMVPYLRVANVFENRIDISDVMEMHFSEEEEKTFRLHANDILLNEGQSLELIGRPAIYRDELPRACFTNTLVRYRAEAGVVPEFALTLFLHYMHSGRFRKIATITTNIAHLGAGRFAEVEFPLPSTEEQTEIMSVLTEKMEALKRQQDAISLALKQSAAQRKNILKAAFTGQLVPQDPNDEPVSSLLARIRTERAEREKRPKPRRTKTSKETTSMAGKLIDVLAEAGDWVTAQEAFRRCGIADGAQTDQIEALYVELRELDKSKRLVVEPVTDKQGRKLYDRLKLVAEA